MKCISIEVTDSFTYVAETDFRSKRPRLYATLTIPTPEGVFQDGNISDPALFAKALLPKIKENNIKSRQVVFLLSSGRIANRDVIIPEVKPNKIMSLLTANASEYFPVDVSGYKLGYNILVPKVSEEEGGGMKLLVIAVPNDLIKSYYKLADSLGFKLLGLDYIGNSIANMVAPALPAAPSLNVKLDDSSSIITIFKDGKPILHRSIGYGLVDALDALMEEKKLSLEESVAELRSTDYFRPAAAASGFDGPDLREYVETLANGIARVADYYNSRNDAKLDKLYLTGFAADFKGLAEYISEITGMGTVVMNDFYGMSVPDGLAIGNYVSAIGAALDPIDLTLTDTRGKKKKQTGASIKEARRTRLLYLLSAGCLIAAIVLAGITMARNAVEKTRNLELQTEKDELLPVVNSFNEYQTTAALHKEVTHIFDLTKNRNEELRRFVEELEEVIPSSAVVTSFSSDGKSAVIFFSCQSKEEAGNLIEELRKFNSISQVSVAGINESRDELTGAAAVQFSATLVYRAVGDDIQEDTDFEGEEAENEEETENEQVSSAGEEGEEE